MAVLVRITDFVPSTLIKSQEMDDELNQLVNLLSGVSTNKDTLLKFSDGSNPVLRVDQLGAGLIQQWLQNGIEKANITNAGAVTSVGMTSTGQISTSFNNAANPALNVNQIGAGLIQRWQNNGIDRATLSALGKLLLPAGIGATPSTDQISNFGTYFSDPDFRTTPANTNETDFSSKTVAANTVGAAGDFIIIFSKIHHAADANGKRYRIYWDAGGTPVTIHDSGVVTYSGVISIVLVILWRDTGGSLNTGSVQLTQGQNPITTSSGTGGVTFNASHVLKSTGQNSVAAANDIFQLGFTMIKGSV